MIQIQRYGPLFDILDKSNEMEPIADGEYVKFEDYEKLKAQLERAEESLRKTINVADFFSRHADCRKDSWACKCEFCRDTTSTRDLREAREYFKEKENK